MLYRMGYFEFSSLFWGAKEENEIKAVTEGKPGSDYNCAMFKIFNSTDNFNLYSAPSPKVTLKTRSGKYSIARHLLCLMKTKTSVLSEALAKALG